MTGESPSSSGRDSSRRGGAVRSTRRGLDGRQSSSSCACRRGNRKPSAHPAFRLSQAASAAGPRWGRLTTTEPSVIASRVRRVVRSFGTAGSSGAGDAPRTSTRSRTCSTPPRYRPAGLNRRAPSREHRAARRRHPAQRHTSPHLTHERSRYLSWLCRCGPLGRLRGGSGWLRAGRGQRIGGVGNRSRARGPRPTRSASAMLRAWLRSRLVAWALVGSGSLPARTAWRSDGRVDGAGPT